MRCPQRQNNGLHEGLEAGEVLDCHRGRVTSPGRRDKRAPVNRVLCWPIVPLHSVRMTDESNPEDDLGFITPGKPSELRAIPLDELAATYRKSAFANLHPFSAMVATVVVVPAELRVQVTEPRERSLKPPLTGRIPHRLRAYVGRLPDATHAARPQRRHVTRSGYETRRSAPRPARPLEQPLRPRFGAESSRERYQHRTP